MGRRSKNPPTIEAARIWQDTGVPTVSTLESGIRSLERLYTFRRGGEVSRFIERHPFLIPLLLEAYGKIESCFGPYPQVLLEVVNDPEVQGWVELFGYIATRLTPEEAGRRLHRFDRGWFLSQLPHVKGLLNFDVEFL